MKKLDFISGAPKTFIFQQDSNKTNLGGLLTILFIIAMLIIIYSYIYEYFANDKYNISYYYNEVHYEDEELNDLYNNEKLYPELTYLLFSNEKAKDLIILDSNSKEIPLLEVRKEKVSELFFRAFHKCKNETYCGSEDGADKLNLFVLGMIYDGYFCDHQNPESPIKMKTTYKYFPFTIEDRIDYYLFNWKIIKYEEESSFSGMFRSTKETYGGVFTGTEKYSIPSEGFENLKK